MKKIKIGILFGGKSVEHEVSLLSAKNVFNALDKNKYEPILIGITKEGKWQLENKESLFLKASSVSNQLPSLKSGNNTIGVIPDNKNRQLVSVEGHQVGGSLDVIFPILHGSFGEDGTVQGLLKLAGIPFVGPSVLGSAVGFDKDVTKRLLTEAGIPNTKFITLRLREKKTFSEAKKILGLPMIIKPANSGSSVGITKVKNEKEFNQAVKYAFKFDNKIILETFIKNKKEIECAVLGNEDPKASICGEVITNKKHEFYSYEAKYIDENGAALEIPAKISKSLQNKIQKLAIKTFKTLECEGLSRVDFFVKDNGEVLVNEINTIPGFTAISMYPKLWEASGISYTKLIDNLIQFAIERFKREQKLRTSVK